MADFENTLNSLLSNPDVMGQIMSFAKSLGGDGGDGSDDPDDPNQPHASQEASSSADTFLGDLLSGVSGLDPALLGMLGNILEEYRNDAGQVDKNTALISALRPFLKEKRQKNIDKAIQLAKISRIARLAFRAMKGGDASV